MTDTALTPFRYGDEQVRTYEDEKGELWFVAIDVARILGYKDATHLTRVLDSDEKGLRSVETLGGEQTLSTISEAGLFHALNSARVEAAKPFRRWITHEVLPSIRRPSSASSSPRPAANTPRSRRAHDPSTFRATCARGAPPRTR